MNIETKKLGEIKNQADMAFIEIANCIFADEISDKDEKVRTMWPDKTPAHTMKTFGVANRYDMRSGYFPALSLRKVFLKSAFQELSWIWQKKSNNVNDLETRIWDSWADESGSIGKAYGYQLGIKHKYPEGEFDQVDRVLFDLKNNPSSRRIMTNIYNHADLNEMGLAPCAYGVTFNVTNGELNCLLNQRSQDMLTANGWNVAQYAMLLLMMAKDANLKPGVLLHIIADAHIYDRHIPIVKELITKPSFPEPKVILHGEGKSFYEFTFDDFEFVDYKYNEFNQKIEVAL